MATPTSSLLLMKLYFMITILQYFISMLAKSDTYIIHMDITAMPKAFSDHHSWYTATLSSATTSSSSLNLVYTYTNVLHGFSASLSPYELEILEKSPGFISSIPDLPVKVHTTRTSRFLNLNSVLGAWPESDYGSDVIVGVIDTGIWPESRSFNDDGGFKEIPSRWKGECVDCGMEFNSSMCNKKLIGAKVFYKGAVSNNPNLTSSMYSPRDMDGHGTHTSSTAAGNYVEGASYFGYASGTAVGMAPKAHVAMYKVVWDDYNSFASDVLAAIDQAIEDGVDVLSISLGVDPRPLYNDPIAIATFAAMEKGIFVSSSAGNEGPDYGVAHNGIPWVVTVGAGTIDRDFRGIITLSNGVSVAGSSLYPLNSSHINQVPLIFMNNCLSPEELKKVGRKIVVCLYAGYLIGDQIDNVNNGDAVGGIFISNISSFDFYIQTSFPAVFLSPQDGQNVLDFINMSSDPRASLEFQKTCVGKTKIAPRVDDYSSRGPSQSCPNVLKPDILAPGTLVLASWPKSCSVTDIGSRHLLSDFNIILGTSMACPHVSGIGALIKGIHPDWSPAAIRSAMMTTANILDNTRSPIMDIGNGFQPASPLAMGAGHINPNKAIDPGLIYDANADDYVNFLCSMNFTRQQFQSITRSKSYACSNPSPDLNYPSFIAYFNANDSAPEATTVREFTRTLTNVGEGMATYISVLIGTMDEFDMSVEPGVLFFTEKHEKQSYTLTIKGPKLMKEMVAHGFVAWLEIGGGEHVVRSPIVATRLSSKPLSG